MLRKLYHLIFGERLTGYAYVVDKAHILSKKRGAFVSAGSMIIPTQVTDPEEYVVRLALTAPPKGYTYSKRDLQVIKEVYDKLGTGSTLHVQYTLFHVMKLIRIETIVME